MCRLSGNRKYFSNDRKLAINSCSGVSKWFSCPDFFSMIALYGGVLKEKNRDVSLLVGQQNPRIKLGHTRINTCLPRIRNLSRRTTYRSSASEEVFKFPASFSRSSSSVAVIIPNTSGYASCCRFAIRAPRFVTRSVLFEMAN